MEKYLIDIGNGLEPLEVDGDSMNRVAKMVFDTYSTNHVSICQKEPEIRVWVDYER